MVCPREAECHDFYTFKIHFSVFFWIFYKRIRKIKFYASYLINTIDCIGQKVKKIQQREGNTFKYIEDFSKKKNKSRLKTMPDFKIEFVCSYLKNGEKNTSSEKVSIEPRYEDLKSKLEEKECFNTNGSQNVIVLKELHSISCKVVLYNNKRNMFIRLLRFDKIIFLHKKEEVLKSLTDKSQLLRTSIPVSVENIEFNTHLCFFMKEKQGRILYCFNSHFSASQIRNDQWGLIHNSVYSILPVNKKEVCFLIKELRFDRNIYKLNNVIMATLKDIHGSEKKLSQKYLSDYTFIMNKMTCNFQDDFDPLNIHLLDFKRRLPLSSGKTEELYAALDSQSDMKKDPSLYYYIPIEVFVYKGLFKGNKYSNLTVAFFYNKETEVISYEFITPNDVDKNFWFNNTSTEARLIIDKIWKKFEIGERFKFGDKVYTLPEKEVAAA